MKYKALDLIVREPANCGPLVHISAFYHAVGCFVIWRNACKMILCWERKNQVKFLRDDNWQLRVDDTLMDWQCNNATHLPQNASNKLSRFVLALRLTDGSCYINALEMFTLVLGLWSMKECNSCKGKACSVNDNTSWLTRKYVEPIKKGL